MFRRTDPQATLGSLSVLLSPEKSVRLEKNHWTGAFRHKAFVDGVRPIHEDDDTVFTLRQRKVELSRLLVEGLT